MESKTNGGSGREFVPIWARSERASSRERPSLSREKIVCAAVEIADEEGPEAVSMRRIASRLGSGTMSLYRYVETKSDLLDLMLDEVYGEIEPPKKPSGDWRADLRLIAHHTRGVMRRHTWFVSLIGEGRTLLGPNALRHIEFFLAAFDSADLDMRAVAGMFGAVNDYVMGAVLRELSEEEARRRGGLTPEEGRAALAPYVRGVVESGRYPSFARYIMEAPHLDDYDERFEIGLDYVLDGIAAHIS